MKRAVWLEKWLTLKTDRNSDLPNLEDAIWRFCCGYAKNPSAGKLLLLFGGNGNGKTHSAKAVARWARAIANEIRFVQWADIVRIPEVAFWRWPELLDAFKEGAWHLTKDIIKAELVIIDEIGGGHDPSQIGTEKLCQVLSRREEKWTLITTNLSPQTWRDKFDQRVVSRFYRNSEQINLSNVPDYMTNR
jgi:DNA replication protein DnaC